MARPPRLDPPDGWHDVMNRGPRRQAIFADDRDREDFLRLLGETAPRFGLEVHAYALLPDQFHLLLRSRRGRLSRGMRHLQHTWTQTVNRRHGWDGPLFRSRFRSRLVEDERDLCTLVASIHDDPVRAGQVARAEDAPWTSHRACAGLAEPPPWLHTDDVARGSLSGGAPRRPPDPPSPLDPHEVLDRIEALTGASLEALRRSGKGPGANAERRFAVWALRADTELSQSEVGELLRMSTRQVQNVEFQQRKRGWRPPVDGWVRAWCASQPDPKP